MTTDTDAPASRSRGRALVELARLSNGPTVVSNVFVGVAIGAVSTSVATWWETAMLAAAVLLLYVAGMALNDVMDAAIDRTERPTRPIPAGRISQSAATAFAIVTMLVGLGLLAPFGAAAIMFGAALALLIVAYDAIHKRAPWSVVLMGACRGMAYLTAAAAVAWPLDWAVAAPLAGAITLYIVVLTLVARAEAKRDVGSRGWLAVVLPIVAIAPAIMVHPDRVDPWMLATGAAVVVWLGQSIRHVRAAPPRIGPAVHAWLAGICLVDAFYLSLLERPAYVAIALACFGLTLLGHRFIPGT